MSRGSEVWLKPHSADTISMSGRSGSYTGSATQATRCGSSGRSGLLLKKKQAQRFRPLRSLRTRTVQPLFPATRQIGDQATQDARPPWGSAQRRVGS